MDLTRLQELKQRLRADKELAPVWDFFLDTFGQKPEFIALGERTSHPFVEVVVTRVGAQLFGPGGPVVGLILTRLPDHDFIHGGFQVGGRLGGVIYFDDVGVGLLVVVDRPPSDKAKYARFSGHPIKAPGPPSAN